MKKSIEAVIIIVTLMLLLFVLKDINFVQVYDALTHINLSYFYLALTCCVFSFVVWNVRWLDNISAIIKGNDWFLSIVFFAGFFVNAITPGAGTAGEPVRAYFLNKKYNKPISEILGCLLADKILNLLVFSFFVIFSISFLLIYTQIAPILRIILEIILGISVISFIASFIAFYKKRKFKTTIVPHLLFKLKFIRNKFKTQEKLKEYLDKRLNSSIDRFRSVILDKRKFILGIFIGAIYWILMYLSSYFLFISFGERIDLISVIIAVTIGYLIGDIAPVPGGIGFTEGTMFLIYSALGISAPIAALVTLLSRAMYLLISLLPGGLCLLYLRIKLKN